MRCEMGHSSVSCTCLLFVEKLRCSPSENKSFSTNFCEKGDEGLDFLFPDEPRDLYAYFTYFFGHKIGRDERKFAFEGRAKIELFTRARSQADSYQLVI